MLEVNRKLFLYLRYDRAQGRKEAREKHGVAKALLDLYESEPIIDDPEYTASPIEMCVDREVQTVVTSSEVDSEVDSEYQRLMTENLLLKAQLNSYKFNQDSFEHDDERVRFYTGLPGYLTLMALFQFVSAYIPYNKGSDLGTFERLVMTLMRLKLNLSVKDLSYRFHCSCSTVSRVFLTVTHILYVRLKHKLHWPDREELRKTMPLSFRREFGKKTAVIIDCFEVFIQRPSAVLARAQTWSSYKHNNTIKFLIGITPQGSISFLSSAYGGRASDKFITEHCGLLNKLLPGDLVLADRGFDIADSVGMCCAQVNIPSFTKGKSQLSPIDIETTRKIANVRIHVERVIGLVRNKYTMLQDKLPIDFLKSEENATPVIDKIATVSCALTNMCESVVPFD